MIACRLEYEIRENLCFRCGFLKNNLHNPNNI